MPHFSIYFFCIYFTFFSIELSYLYSDQHTESHTEDQHPHTLHLPDSLIFSDPHNNLETKIRTKKEVKPLSQTALSESFSSFTGKITGNRVRLRLYPNTESAVIRELQPGEFWIIVGETDDFYSVLPKNDTKGYIYRTYILDGVIEGSNVNLRLQPDTQSPIIAQLNQGDVISPSPQQKNSKWVEIDIPSNTLFYIAKQYIKRVGPKSLYFELEQKQNRFLADIKKIDEEAQKELQKPFQEIQLAPFIHQLKSLETDAREFPNILSSIRDRISHIQESYLQLSDIGHQASENFQTIRETFDQRREEKNRIDLPKTTFSLEQQEKNIVSNAVAQGTAVDETDFYQQENERSCAISGILIPYERTVKNRPGDFILIDPHSKVPLAYIYSTKISLQDYLGQHVTLKVTVRPNHFFALPAYFALYTSQRSLDNLE